MANATETITSLLIEVGGVREIWWRWMLANFSDFALFSYVFYAYVVAGYAVVGGFFFILDHFDLFQQYKIQKEVFTSAPAWG
mgnify:CR=1 FL=1